MVLDKARRLVKASRYNYVQWMRNIDKKLIRWLELGLSNMYDLSIIILSRMLLMFSNRKIQKVTNFRKKKKRCQKSPIKNTRTIIIITTNCDVSNGEFQRILRQVLLSMLRHHNRIRIYSGNKAREKFTFMNFALLIIEFETPIFSGIEPTRRFRGRQATLRLFPLSLSLSLSFFFYRQIKVLSFFVPHTIHVNDLL